MKKLLSLSAAALIALAMLTPRAEAQFSFMPYLGYDIDSENLLLGVGAEFPVGPVGLPVGLAVRPSAEYFFTDSDFTLLQFNVDAVGRFSAPAAPVGLYAGAGLAIRYADVNVDIDIPGVDTSSTDFGLNLFGGAEFGSGFAVPFAQARLTVADGSAIAILGGVRFGL